MFYNIHAALRTSIPIDEACSTAHDPSPQRASAVRAFYGSARPRSAYNCSPSSVKVGDFFTCLYQRNLNFAWHRKHVIKMSVKSCQPIHCISSYPLIMTYATIIRHVLVYQPKHLSQVINISRKTA